MSVELEVDEGVKLVLELNIHVVLPHGTFEGGEVLDGGVEVNVSVAAAAEVSVDADGILPTRDGHLDVLDGVLPLTIAGFLNYLTRNRDDALVLAGHLVFGDWFVDPAVATALNVEAKFSINFIGVVFAFNEDGQFVGLAVE